MDLQMQRTLLLCNKMPKNVALSESEKDTTKAKLQYVNEKILKNTILESVSG